MHGTCLNQNKSVFKGLPQIGTHKKSCMQSADTHFVTLKHEKYIYVQCHAFCHLR